MATHQRAASRLLDELNRTAGTLAQYNGKAVQEVIAEINALDSDLAESVTRSQDGTSGDDAASIMVYRETMARNKRCLLAYHMARADQIEVLRWTEGAVLPEHQRAKLSSEEIDYFRNYSELLARHMEAEGMDLTQGFRPPKQNKVAVQALADCGDLVTGKGSVRVKAGDILMLMRSDAEPLIRTGQMVELAYQL